LVASVFTKMLIKEAWHNKISGLLSNMRLGGVFSLQYAYDALLFLQNNVEQDQNLKWLLSLFEEISGMRIIATQKISSSPLVLLFVWCTLRRAINWFRP
jgi:hypothetical protein